MSNTLVSFHPAAFLGYPFVPDIIKNIAPVTRFQTPRVGGQPRIPNGQVRASALAQTGLRIFLLGGYHTCVVFTIICSDYSTLHLSYIRYDGTSFKQLCKP